MLSPGLARNMLAGTFTPNKLSTKFTIPKSTPSSSSKKDAAEKWGPLNFPPSLRKPTYNIGCSEQAQVGIKTKYNVTTNTHDIISQGTKNVSSAPVVNNKLANTESTKSIVNSLQMSHLNDSSSSSGFMEVENDMLDTPARLAKKKRQADLEANRTPASQVQQSS